MTPVRAPHGQRGLSLRPRLAWRRPKCPRNRRPRPRRGPISHRPRRPRRLRHKRSHGRRASRQRRRASRPWAARYECSPRHSPWGTHRRSRHQWLRCPRVNSGLRHSRRAHALASPSGCRALRPPRRGNLRRWGTRRFRPRLRRRRKPRGRPGVQRPHGRLPEASRVARRCRPSLERRLRCRRHLTVLHLGKGLHGRPHLSRQRLRRPR